MNQFTAAYSGDAGGPIGGVSPAKEQAIKQACEANQVERRSGLVPPKRDRIVAASTALFIARERFNALGTTCIPNDRDARLQGQIAYDVARAEMNQAQRDLDSLTR